MKRSGKIIIFTAIIIGCGLLADAQVNGPQRTAEMQKDTLFAALRKPQKVVTRGTVTVEGKVINYKAVAGSIILKNNSDQPTCSMFYAAYFKDDQNSPGQRPVTFIYNGGPGSSTLWLHMGAWGPRRVYTDDTLRVLAPYKTVNNDYSLLDVSDLVFIDAPGTGFSRIIDKDMGGAGDPKDFYGSDEDARAFATFITQFLSTFNLWNSPKYLFGESYGTFRSAALSYILEVEDGVDLNGIIMLSQLLSWDNIADRAQGNPGMDLPYQLALPSLTATAWYHHKLPDQPENLEPLLREVEKFAMGEYAMALSKGSDLDSASAIKISERLHRYTGLPEAYIRKANYRITGPLFEQNLLANNDKVVGRLDSRFSGYSVDPLDKQPSFDPFEASISSAFIATANNYIRTALKFGQNMTFHPFGEGVSWHWDFRHSSPGMPVKFFGNVMPDLAMAMTYNPRLKVMLNMGYFDLGTPYYEGIYEMHHLPMDNALQKNISYAFYKSGHMVYLNKQSLKELHDNVAKFITDSH